MKHEIERKYTNIHTTESMQNITLITILKNWGLEAQKVKEKKSELHCYINGPEKLSVSKTYLIEAFIILLLSSKL